MRNYLSLFRRFIVRAVLREKVRSAITVLGITLGVAVMIAVRLANRSALDTFRTAVDSLRGSAALRVRGIGGRFDEKLLDQLAWLKEYGAASPVIEAYAMYAPHLHSREGQGVKAAPATNPNSSPPSSAPTPPRNELLQILGVDVLQDLPIRNYRLLRTSNSQREPTGPELLRILTDADAIILTEKFARAHGLALGDELSLAFGSRRTRFYLRGLLLDEGPGRALDGHFALLDLAAAQWAADRLGTLDFLDVKLRDGLDAQTTLDAIRRRLPPTLVVERADAQLGRTETMIAAFHFNLAALSAIALVVGLFQIYNTVSISVAARRAEIGMLQAVGASPARVLALFLGEAGLAALLGVGLGLALGQILARAAVTATSQTVETFYIAQAARDSAASLGLGWFEILVAVGVTIPLALLAAAVPAWEAATVQPVEVIHGNGRRMQGFRPPRRYLAIAAALLALGWLLTQLGPIHGLAVFGFVAQLVLTLGGAFCVPAALWIACGLARRLLGRLVPRLFTESLLAASNLRGAISQVAISVAALAVSLAMMVAISIMVGSFRETVVYWLNSTLKADLLVRPTILTSSVMEAKLDPEAVATLRRDPDVAATGWFSARQVPYADAQIRLAAADVRTVLAQRLVLFKTPADAEAAVARGLNDDTVIVSESFALRFRHRPGEVVHLPTPAGMRPFRITAVYYDYASNQGTAVMDGRTWHRHFADDPAAAPSSMSLYLRPGADVEAVRARLAAAVAGRQELRIFTNANVRREALRIFDSTFTITYALELIAVVVAGLGVISTLLTMIYQRQREIAILALLGADPGQIRRMVTLEATLLGGVSQLVGLGLGVLLALVLIYVINVQSYGWTIQFHLPTAFLAQSTLAILAATTLCGLYPAARAASIHAIRVVREE